MTKTTKTPFDVQLTDEQRTELTTTLVEAIRTGLMARDRVMSDNGLLDYAYSLYEQERQSGLTRDVKAGGADLTSPLAMENVDALGARATKTIFVEPLWIVEGLDAESRKKAPAVEEYLQMRQEQMRLQKTVKRWFNAALIEEGAMLEVCEDAEPITCVEVTKAAITRNAEDTAQDPRGSIVVDEQGKPVPQRDAKGTLVPAASQDEFVEVRREYTDYRRRGASLRLHSGKDLLFLPGHAKDDSEIYGQAFRFWRRLDQLEAAADRGEYDTDAVETLGTSQERDTRAEHTRGNQDVEVDHSGKYVDKELWRVQILADLDGTGFAFYIVTLSELHNVILRIRRDWLSEWRGVYANPYPRTYSVYGYSVILGKLITTIEEHTAWRNMNADRGTLKANAPMKALKTEDWDPELQPFGAGQVIRVTDMKGIEPFPFEDISPGAFDRERTCVTDAQRLIGLNDIALGQQSRASRTLGENEMASRESFTRTDDPIGNLQEALEELGALIYAIELKTLEQMEQGMDAPASTVDRLQQRGGAYAEFDGTFTADMIRGKFRFKPRGSVESADPNRRRQQFAQGLGALEAWAKFNPSIAERLRSPEFADALMQMWVTEYKPRDVQAFLKPVQQALPTGQPGAPGAPGAPMPPGAAPGPPGPDMHAGGSPFGGDELIAGLMSHLSGGGQ